MRELPRLNMSDTSPRLWPYSPASSPVSLPVNPILFTQNKVIDLSYTGEIDTAITLQGAELQNYCSNFASDSATLDQLISQHGGSAMSERRPFLLLGELANPYRLQDINIGVLPIYTIRLEGLCRTYADSLDNRDIVPGVHHVTLARSKGWWELSHLAMATIEQMKAMVAWLDNGQRGKWKPVKPAEGSISLHFGQPIECPSKDMVTFDGVLEDVEQEMPPATGPAIDLSKVMVPVHTANGCYNHRGRLARTAHYQQRDFHENIFRKGSSNKWNDVLEIV